MKHHLLMLLCLLLPLSTLWAQDTHYASDPFQLGAGARALGMGSAFVAIGEDATAFYWNPAGFAHHPKRELHAQHTEQFGGSINHDIIALSLPFKKGGVGLALMRLGIDNISLTQLEDPNRPLGPDNRPILTQKVGTTDNAIYMSYAQKIRPLFTWGITLKFIHRNLSVGTGTGLGIDAGLLYQPRPPLTFGLTIRDITKTRIHFDAGHTDAMPPSLLMGISYLYTLSQPHHLLTSISAHWGNDTSGIEKSQVVNLGLEYQFKQRLMLRFGRQGSHFTAGAGIVLKRATIDLAILENNHLNNTYRISTSIFF